MSATPSTAVDDTQQQLARRLDRLEARVESLESTVEEKNDRIEQLEAQLDQQANTNSADNDGRTPDDRIEQLERKLEAKEQQLEDLQVTVDIRHERNIKLLQQIVTGGTDGILDYQDEFIQDHGCLIDQLCGESNSGSIANLQDEIVEEQKQRSIVESRLRKEINCVAEKAGVDVTDSDMVGDDKITRVMRDGPQSVESTVYPVHERACEVLRNIDRWGTRATDKFGDRFVLNSPTVAERLQDRRDEQLTTTEIKRVFAKIESWSQDSPRRVSKDFGGAVNKLLISLEDSEN